MPYTTNVAGTTITAAWGNANVRDQVVTPFASAGARTSAITSPVAGMLSPTTTAPMTLDYYNGTQWVNLLPITANVNATETTTSTVYTDLTTPGPQVTVVTGTTALVAISAGMKHSSTDVAYMGVTVGGASAIGPNDNQAAEVVNTNTITGAMIFQITGLTAGSNIFKARYRTPSGTATFQNRNITVWGLP